MKKLSVGDILASDYQSDIYEGQYRLVEDQGNGNWLAEYVEPNNELIERVRADMFSGHAYLGYHDSFGPERREATPQEAFDKEICDRDRSGRSALSAAVHIQRRVARDVLTQDLRDGLTACG